jgi:hypothetical protein
MVVFLLLIVIGIMWLVASAEHDVKMRIQKNNKDKEQ